MKQLQQPQQHLQQKPTTTTTTTEANSKGLAAVATKLTEETVTKARIEALKQWQQQ